MHLGVPVLPSGEGLWGTPSQHVRSLSHFKTVVWLYWGGERVLFQGPYAQGVRCVEWGLF